jgi:hypothetical protein
MRLLCARHYGCQVQLTQTNLGLSGLRNVFRGDPVKRRVFCSRHRPAANRADAYAAAAARAFARARNRRCSEDPQNRAFLRTRSGTIVQHITPIPESIETAGTNASFAHHGQTAITSCESALLAAMPNPGQKRRPATVPRHFPEHELAWTD